LVATAREAVQRRDTEEFRRVTQLLKDNLSILSAGAAFEAAEKVELIGQSQGLEKFDEAFGWLEEELEHLQLALSNLGNEVTL
jgi:hypothetical protein